MANRRKTVQRDPFGRVQSEYEEENEEEAGYDSSILRDGERLRVPLYLKDGAMNPNLLPHQQAKAANQTQQQAEDAAARRFGLSDGLQLHKPGFRYNTDSAASERIRQAYNDYDAADANAWRGKVSRAHDTSSGAADAGNDQRKDAAADARAEAYRLYDEEQANAWRGSK